MYINELLRVKPFLRSTGSHLCLTRHSFVVFSKHSCLGRFHSFKSFFKMQFSTKVIVAAATLFGQSLAQSWEQQQALDMHNDARRAVGVPELVWDDGLANDAQNWANYLAANNAFQHSGVEGQGENIWEGWGESSPFSSAATGWINEKSSYHGEAIDSSNYQTFGHYSMWSPARPLEWVFNSLCT
jgi:uncharacterized protein YkwD